MFEFKLWNWIYNFIKFIQIPTNFSSLKQFRELIWIAQKEKEKGTIPLGPGHCGVQRSPHGPFGPRLRHGKSPIPLAHGGSLVESGRRRVAEEQAHEEGVPIWCIWGWVWVWGGGRELTEGVRRWRRNTIETKPRRWCGRTVVHGELHGYNGALTR
jgi:hypothetical protein